MLFTRIEEYAVCLLDKLFAPAGELTGEAKILRELVVEPKTSFAKMTKYPMISTSSKNATM